MARNRFLILILLAALFLAGCAGSSTPKMIGSYPSGSHGETGQPQYSPPAEYVYDAYIELEVSNADRATSRAEDLAYGYGGYLVSSQSWRMDGKKNITLTLAVPAANFGYLRAALLDLGTVLSENVSGEWVQSGYGSNEWNIYSQITLQLHSKAFSLPTISLGGWRPLQTLLQALGVSLSIFSFVVDFVIWIVVVLGPFVLLIWGVRLLYRKLRH